MEETWWIIHANAESGRPGDTNPVARFTAVTYDGLPPSDDTMVRAAVWSGVSRGRRNLVYHPIRHSAPDQRSVEPCFEYGGAEVWLIE